MAKAVDNKLPLRDLDRHSDTAPIAATAADTIGSGCKVTLHFSLKLVDQQLIDSNFDSSPATLVLGNGDMLPGFERVLLGKKAGDTVEALIPAAEAFGMINPDNQQRFPHFQFPPDMSLAENLMIEFNDASGYKQAGRVAHVGKQYVEIDFNHPLAGRDIVFTAAIHKVEHHT
jgi:FKBP-type peptidyl-prolyl cis-trans isomerase SlpA